MDEQDDSRGGFWQRRVSRRRLLGSAAAGGIAAGLAACGAGPKQSAPPASVSTPAATAAGAALPPEWEQTLAAARKEGKVSVDTYPGEGYNRALAPFQKAYPDIKLEQTNLHIVDLAPRIIQERKAGVFTWDVVIAPTTTSLQVLRPAGTWDPIRPAILLPDVKDDKNWRGGFEAGFIDNEKQWCYAPGIARGNGIYANTDQVKDGEIKSVNDLLAPKWRGKMIMADPRVLGASFWPMTVARQKLGDDIIKRLFIDQQVVLSRDEGQLTEFMVRGTYPIGLGVMKPQLQKFLDQGLGKNLKQAPLPEMDFRSSGQPAWLVNKAPHPNAAKVFINWLLSAEGQASWDKEVQVNSRRVGAPTGDPTSVVPEGLDLYQIDTEEHIGEVVKTQDIAKQTIK